MKTVFFIFSIGLFCCCSSKLRAEDIRDIKPPVFFPPDYQLLFVILIFLLIAGLVFLWVFLKKKIKRPPATAEKVIPRSAHEIAYDALRILYDKKLPQQGEIKLYYSELSDIVRCYMENRFSYRAPEMTTDEFLEILRDSDYLSGTQKNLLKNFLVHCDLVKFAKYGPNQQEIEDSFLSAKRLIDETKKAETPA